MGRDALAADSRFATHAARIANEDALDAAIEAWTCTRDRYDIQNACQAAGIAAGAVQDAADLTGRDPNLAARKFFGMASPIEGWGEYGLDQFPALFDGRRPDTYAGPGPFAADTFDVLTEVLGIGDGEFAQLVDSGALS